MHIGIDARLIAQTGVGRYIRNLINGLAVVDRTNTYTVFMRSEDMLSVQVPEKRFTKVRTDIHWHTVREQLVLPRVFTRAGLDLLHVPYFNAPVLYHGKTVLTIHDLTYLHFTSGRSSTLPMPVYMLKQAAYRGVMRLGIRNACHILTVSEATRDDIVREYPQAAERITVTYEGVDRALSASRSRPPKSVKAAGKPYFLYVGNAYPHKNLERLLDAFVAFRRDIPKGASVRLVLVGPDDYFYQRLKDRVHDLGVSGQVVFFGPGTDADLAYLYGHALAGVFPSLAEGFGLPPLEALASGCRVLCSDIPVFREILGDQARYFRADDIPSIRQALFMGYSSAAPAKQELPGGFLKRFSWEAMARQTKTVYETCGSRP